QKLDQHLTVIRDLETRLQAEGSSLTNACSAPTRHPASGNANPDDNYILGNAYNNGLPYFDKICDFQIELLAQILICDLTRFATLVFAGTSGPGLHETRVPILDGPGDEVAATGTDRPIPEDFHDSIAHKSDQELLAVQQAVATVNRYYYGKI